MSRLNGQILLLIKCCGLLNLFSVFEFDYQLMILRSCRCIFTGLKREGCFICWHLISCCIYFKNVYHFCGLVNLLQPIIFILGLCSVLYFY